MSTKHTLTRAQIAAVRQSRGQAVKRGDNFTIDLCDRALDGDLAAVRTCAENEKRRVKFARELAEIRTRVPSPEEKKRAEVQVQAAEAVLVDKLRGIRADALERGDVGAVQTCDLALKSSRAALSAVFERFLAPSADAHAAQ